MEPPRAPPASRSTRIGRAHSGDRVGTVVRWSTGGPSWWLRDRDAGGRRSRRSCTGRAAGRFSVEVPVPEPLAQVDGLLAGAAEVDITPPPGLPKAGYSSNAHIGNGFRTRLRARVAAPAGRDRRRWRSCSATCSAGRRSSSTWSPRRSPSAPTSRSPGSGSGPPTPTPGPASSSAPTSTTGGRRTGRASTRPGPAPRRAHRRRGHRGPRHPAPGPAGGRQHRGVGADPQPVARPVRPQRHGHRQAHRPAAQVGRGQPALHLVRVDTIDEAAAGAGTTPLAAAVVFSVHGTGISKQAHEYNADLWAYLVGELAHRLEQRHGHRPVVGAMEGTHADVAPALRPGMAGHREAERIGRGIGADAADLHERLGAELASDGPSRRRAPRGRPRRGRPTARSTASSCRTDRRSAPPSSPAPPRTSRRSSGASRRSGPGRPRRWGAAGPHGPKWVIGCRWGQPLVQPIRTFPRVLAVQVAAHRRHRARRPAVRDHRGERPAHRRRGRRRDRASGQATTSRRRPGRRVLGGQRVLGLRDDARGVRAAVLRGRPHHLRPEHAAVPRRPRRHGSPARCGRRRRRRRPPSRPDAGTSPPTATCPSHDGVDVERRFLTGADVHRPDERRRRLLGGDLARRRSRHAPVDVTDRAGRRVRRRRGRLASRRCTATGVAADDQGWSIEVTHLGPDVDRGGHRYRARWFDPVLRADRRHRFTLLANGPQPQLEGPAFD